MAALIRIVAVAACTVIVVGFTAFANEEAGRGSEKQVERVDVALNDLAPSAAAERRREREHSHVRELLDDANDVLLTPFAGVAPSDDVWVKRLIPTALALLVYGLGLTLLANFLPRRATPSGGDWRTAA